jgi:hypothetical protein
MTLRRLEYILAFSVSSIAFVVYVSMLCPTVNFVDAGELATVCATLGIAHPSSYPLFTLIGWVAAHLPLGLRMIYQLNLLTAVECSVAVFFFFRFLVFFTNEISIRHRTLRRTGPEKVSFEQSIRLFLPALCGTSILAFSDTYWTQALSIEVYSLHVMFIIILLFVFTKAVSYDYQRIEQSPSSGGKTAYWFLFAYLLGLAFTNHLTTIILAPAFLFLYFSVNRSSAASWKRILFMGPLFILSLTLYAYVIIRANSSPIMAWGNPINFERFYWLFSGKIYHGYLFSPEHHSSWQYDTFVNGLLPQFAYVPLVLAPIGIWSLFKDSKILLSFTLLLLISCLGFAFNYDIPDIDAYFLLAYIVIALWIALGIEYLLRWSLKSSLVRVAGVVLLVISLLPLFYNYSRVDESKNVWVEDYVRNMVSSLEPNAIILSYQYDYFNVASNYFQLVENLRPDVVVLDKNLMQRPWYYLQLETRYRGMIELPKGEIATFSRSMLDIERNISYDTLDVDRQILNLVHLILNDNYNTHPIYVTQEIEQAYTPGFRRIPSGLAFRLYRDTLYHYIPMPELVYHPPTKVNWNTLRLTTCYAQAYANNAIYSDYLGMKTLAMQQIDRALEIMPNSEDALMIKEQLQRNR